MSVDWIVTLWYMALWIITNKKSHNPCWCCFISFADCTACLIIVAVKSPLLTLGFCHTSWAARVHCRMSDGRTWTDACWVEPGKPTGKGKARSGVQLKDATRCQKNSKRSCTWRSCHQHVKKLTSFLRKLHNFIHILAPQVCVRPDVAPPPAWVDLTPWLGRDNCASLPARTLFKLHCQRYL